ncbi:hypothetical protein ACFX11_011501 [Malus domestica]
MYMYECLGPAATKGLSHKPNSVEKKHKTQISPKQHPAQENSPYQSTPQDQVTLHTGDGSSRVTDMVLDVTPVAIFTITCRC